MHSSTYFFVLYFMHSFNKYFLSTCSKPGPLNRTVSILAELRGHWMQGRKRPAHCREESSGGEDLGMRRKSGSFPQGGASHTECWRPGWPARSCPAWHLENLTRGKDSLVHQNKQEVFSPLWVVSDSQPPICPCPGVILVGRDYKGTWENFGGGVATYVHYLDYGVSMPKFIKVGPFI